MTTRIVIVGAVGGYFGAYLTRAGHAVTLVDGWPDHVEAMRRDGLQISGVTPAEAFSVRVDAVHLNDVQAFARQQTIDIAIIAVKAYDTEWATALIRPYLAPSGYIVSLQNGINEDRIAAIVGWGKAVGCIVAQFASELHAPGRIRRNYPRGDANTVIYRTGEASGRMTERVEAFTALAADVDTARATPNLWGERWSKLCVNGMRNALSAASGLAGNEINRVRKIRRFGIRLGGEAVRIGQALGYPLERIYGLVPERLARAAEGDTPALAEIEDSLMAAANRSGRSDLQRPSMGQDILKGRRTEVDFINGLIVASGREAGLPVEAHETVTRLVQRIERGEIRPSPDHFPQA
ncbi:ketopantoate reductase family protein [Dongia sedimenti]|uniref:2-dehydropantoate 2-reductase n=1 Tax=Dongia sedimenti TaxID=3064282 RepID=A0ABU0YTI9_9PROT|nr:2-dehydropantoate 2-reductase [Rhodospirillaceae bacterium R-7]